MAHRPPNILWFCTDQQRWDTVAALGQPAIHTPQLDRLCADGTAFTHAFCQSPICTPSRASFLTGRYPSTIRACRNGNAHWADAAPLVTAQLAAAGYDCGLAGKLHLAGAADRIEPRPPHDGYRVFQWSHHPRDDWPAGHAYANWLRAQGLDPALVADNPAALDPAHHQTTWCTDRALEFIDEPRLADQPWLVSVNVFDPHPPFDPPAAYRQRYDAATLPPPHFRPADLAAQSTLAAADYPSAPRDPATFNAASMKADYYAMIELIDHNVGRLLDHLDTTGQREVTLVIFMSDHGDMLGDHGLVAKGCRFYEPLVRVPLIVALPGRIAAGQRCAAMVELTDLAPTLLDYAGLPADPGHVGRSLRPLLERRADPAAHREAVRAEYYATLNRPRLHPAHGYATMLRTTTHKLVRYHGLDRGELFDLVADPHEFDNRWGDPACADLRFQLLARSFDALALATDLGPPVTQRF